MKIAGNNRGTARVVLIAVLAVIILAVCGGYAYYYSITRGPLPQVDGELKVAGLKDRVEVIRDAHGVAHIYAKNMHDLFLAQGYVQAQDRWWQMEFFRHTCAGRIQELTGKKPALVAADIYLRSLGLYRVCAKEYSLLAPSERAVLDAFAEGVNAYLAGKKPGRLSVNYSILGLTGVKFKIDPWTPLDALAFSKIMAWDLGLRRDLELTRTRLHRILGAEMAEKWMVPKWPIGKKPTILLDDDIKALTAALRSGPSPLERRYAAAGRVYDETAPGMDQVLGANEGAGSNSWVAAGSQTKSGAPLLANDPHLGIQMPSIWYEIGLHSADDGTGRPFDVAGFTFAAAAGVVVGHNSDIAWGTTNVYPDVNDQYMIKVNPKNPLQYGWNGAWRDMTVREETILFGNGKPPLAIKVRVTHLGPIINDNKYDPDKDALEGYNNKDPLALKWTALEPSRIATAITRLDRARNWDEFNNALKDWDVPSQSFVYADRRGNIGYLMPGKIPVRRQGHTGQVPVPGWSGEYEWKGYIPHDLLPRAYNPARGYIVAANQEVAPPAYYAFLNQKLGPGVNADFGSRFNKWIYGYRSQRIYELMRRLSPHTVATYQAIQGDNKYISAGEVLPFLAGLKFDDREVADARDWLLKWDRVCGEDSPHAALYAEFWMKLNANVFQNKLGDAAKADGVDREMWAVALLLDTPKDKWWDDPSTKDRAETRDEVLARSFREGHAATVAALGRDRARWRWGDLHTATFVSTPLGASKIGPLESLVNRGPVPVGGNTECVNANMWQSSFGDFAIRSIPSMRMIVDLGDPGKSVCVNSTGQSGHPGSPWYGDMIESWRKVTYHPMPWTRKQVDEGAAHRLVLSP